MQIMWVRGENIIDGEIMYIIDYTKKSRSVNNILKEEDENKNEI